MNCYKNLALFAGGILFGSAGVKLLASKDAKKVYTHAAAAALRMKDSVMQTVTCVQENAAGNCGRRYVRRSRRGVTAAIRRAAERRSFLFMEVNYEISNHA